MIAFEFRGRCVRDSAIDVIRTTLRGDDKNKDIDAFVRRPLLLPLCKRIAACLAPAPLAAPLFRAGVVAINAEERLGNTRTNSSACSLCLAIVKGSSCARAIAYVCATYPHHSSVLLIYLICLFFVCNSTPLQNILCSLFLSHFVRWLFSLPLPLLLLRLLRLLFAGRFPPATFSTTHRRSTVAGTRYCFVQRVHSQCDFNSKSNAI